MDKGITTQGVLFKELNKKPVIVRFDQEHASSDGGALLLKSCDQKLKLSESISSCLNDNRQSGKVRHRLIGLFQQRLLGIACG